MKFTTKSVVAPVEILANDHFVSVSYDCTNLTSLATDGVIPAGTVIPANNSTAKGILLNDVNLNENPNGAIVIHGFIKTAKLPAELGEGVAEALKQITFLD